MESQHETLAITTNYLILQDIDFITKLLTQVFGLYM